MKICLFVVVDGLALFIDEHFTLDLLHVDLLMMVAARPDLYRTPVVIAYTMERLFSTSCSGKFFGSPLLLHRWFMSHCRCHAKFAKLNVHECILHLGCLSLEDFNFVPKMSEAYKARVMSTVHNHLELVLVGARSFVLYPIQCCPRLLNQELIVPASSVLTPPICVHKKDGDHDKRMALEYITRWAYVG